MYLEFHNDGSYGDSCVYSPFLIEDCPVGFIKKVTESSVICEIFDEYFFRNQMGVNITSKEQDIRAVGLKRPKSATKDQFDRSF